MKLGTLSNKFGNFKQEVRNFEQEGFAKGFFKVAKVIRKIPNELGTQNRNALRSLAGTPHTSQVLYLLKKLT